MAALTSSSWTVSFRNGDRILDTKIVGRKKEVDLKLVLVSGEISAGGVPLPTYKSLGMVRNLDFIKFHHSINMVNFTTARARAIQWVCNVTANKLVALQMTMPSGSGSVSGGRSLRTVATAQAIPTNTFYITAVGW